MTPDIRPFLREADRRKPHLRIDNRIPSCFELLEDALALAGPDWKFIGKSSQRGEAGFRPAWFTPVMVPCRRPDGQTEGVLIDQLGMDAAWHPPSGRQIKVIVNSTANELPPGDPRRGPASLDSYEIPPVGDNGEQHYRWHNPPMPQSGAPGVPMPGPGPTPPTQPPTHAGRLPGRDEALNELEFLDSYYRSREGLDRQQGLSLAGAPDFEGVAAWYLDVYQNARLAGASREEARAAYIRDIRNSNEWKAKHPGETP